MSDIDLAVVRDRRPLAVQVYDRMHDALAGAQQVGTEIPTEVELSAALGVSRTTVRQALALLEEDGILQRGKGRRRIVAPRSVSVVNNAPLEEMIVARSPLSVSRVRRLTLPATRWSSGLLGVAHESALTVCESVVTMDGRVVASALELTPPDVADDTWTVSDSTLLAELGAAFRARSTLVLSRLSAHSAQTREGFDGGIDTSSNAIVLTQLLAEHGRPIYLAKHVVKVRDVSLTLVN